MITIKMFTEIVWRPETIVERDTKRTVSWQKPIWNFRILVCEGHVEIVEYALMCARFIVRVVFYFCPKMTLN